MRHFSFNQFRERGNRQTEALAGNQSLDSEIAAEAGPAPKPRRIGSVWWIIASGVVLIAVIAFGTAILVSDFRDRARSETKRELNNTAYILAEYCERTLQSIELVQKTVIEKMQSLGLASSGDLGRLMSGFDTHLMLKDMVTGVTQLDALVLVDPSGKLVVSSRSWPMPDADESDREFF